MDTNVGKTTKPLRVVIFNWRCIKHKWAGGAEMYVHELAKQWAKQGTAVTLFCANDGTKKSQEVIDGIRIIRRGGFSTVYLWAFLYYLFSLRRKTDVIIDVENGIPFFTPLYARKPVYLLIHHIHQEVFRQSLPYPKAKLAQFLEGKLMPLVYRNKQVITVSETSKQEIIRVNHKRFCQIAVINPGVSVVSQPNIKKTTYPSLLYLGRLKPYKHIDIAIKAFAKVVAQQPNARLTIAGTGPALYQLKKLVKRLALDYAVTFLGYVGEQEKSVLLHKSWALVQPSMMEGWGMTVIEANACGTPVIASNAGGLKDSVLHGKTGLLVSVGHVDGFAQAMQRVLSDTSLRNSMSAVAKEWAKQFSWQQSANKLHTLLDNRNTATPELPAANVALAKRTA